MLVDIAPAEDFNHLSTQVIHNFQSVLRGQLIDIGFKQIILQVDLLEHHLGVKEVGIIDVDVHRIIPAQGGRVDVILDGGDRVIQKQLLTVDVAGETAHPVVHGDNIGIEGADEVIQSRKRGDGAAGGNVDVHPKGGKAGFGVVFVTWLLSRCASWV